MSDLGRKDIGDKIESKVKPDSQKSTFEQAKDKVTDAVDNLAGGIRTYVYNSDSLSAYVKSFNNATTNIDEIPVNVVYLIHPRLGNYKFTESIAYNVLHQYYAKKQTTTSSSTATPPLICVTFDLRNHGEREVDSLNNYGWNELPDRKNDTHAVDMVSSIMGNVADIKLIIDFLPSYLNLDALLSNRFKQTHQHYNIQYNNILSGYSLGGHTVFRFANEYPDLVTAINPVVGSIDLSSLLVNRLKQNPVDGDNYDKKWFFYNYAELGLTAKQQDTQYPETFHKLLSKQDEDIFENFPMGKIAMFASFGKEDTLVPPRLSLVWCDTYLNTNDKSEVFVQDGVGHEVTKEMIDSFTTWLAKLI
ncbi:hypothetical protein CANMA_003952 [Candida margitis]|uniref:uncharacterized protein n=1 Tax=Candida margitis TaxID=1775924 RepID=UPI002227ACEB|nr:uncharacterized protein CANMA_003952 [Candida margitis]KAI5960866.1 hypothetical protein CANMA_003952 [Candida margitis]